MPEVRGNPIRGLTGATLGFFAGFAAVALFGPSAAKFKDAMDLTPVMVGFLVAMPALSGSLLRIPFAAWVDTVGGRKPFMVLLSLSIVGMAGLTILVAALYPDDLGRDMYPLLLLLGLMCGCGIATFSVGISQVSYWFPQSKQGSALGTYAGIGNLAPGIFTFLIPVALSGWGLAGSYLAWLVFLTLGAVLYYVVGRNAPFFQLRASGASDDEARRIAFERHGQEIFPKGRLIDSLRLSAKAWKTWVLVLIYFTTFGGFIALTAWLPTYWKSYFDVGTFTASAFTATFALTASVIRVFGGRVSDALGGERTAIGALLVLLVGAIVMTQSHSQGPSIVGEVIMALGMGVGNAAVFKLVPQEVPDAVGGASGWVGGLGALGGFAIPPTMGAFVSASGDAGYADGFLVIVGLAVFALALAYVLIRTREKALRARPVGQAR